MAHGRAWCPPRPSGQQNACGHEQLCFRTLQVRAHGPGRMQQHSLDRSSYLTLTHPAAGTSAPVQTAPAAAEVASPAPEAVQMTAPPAAYAQYPQQVCMHFCCPSSSTGVSQLGANPTLPIVLWHHRQWHQGLNTTLQPLLGPPCTQLPQCTSSSRQHRAAPSLGGRGWPLVLQQPRQQKW